MKSFTLRAGLGLYNFIGTGMCCALLLAAAPAVSFAQTYGVVVPGLGGTPDYDEAFTQSATDVADGLRSLERDESLIVLLESTATRQDILDAIDQQVQRMQTDAQANGQTATQGSADSDIDGTAAGGAQAGSPAQATFALAMIGHGNANSGLWRFNVAGPDITGDDLVAALNSVPTARQLVLLAASASGATLESLSQLGRVLVTATKSGGEINASRFHEYLAQAMQGDVADYDRNEILTVSEAYRFANARTREYYEEQGLLASEHPRLRSEEADDIAVALLGSLQDAKDDPVVAGLLDERLVLEQDFKLLRQRKPEMAVEEYYQELESLLLSIARLQQSIDEVTGWNENDADS